MNPSPMVTVITDANYHYQILTGQSNPNMTNQTLTGTGPTLTHSATWNEKLSLQLQLQSSFANVTA